MYQFPVKYYDGNLIISENGFWAGFELIGYDYDNQGESSKLKILGNLINFLSKTQDEMKILLIPIQQNKTNELKRNYNKIKDSDPLKYVAKNHAEGTIEYLESKKTEKIFIDSITGDEIKLTEDKINDYKTFVLTKLVNLTEKDYLKDMKSIMEYIFKEPKMVLDSILGVNTRILLQSKIEAVRKAARAYRREQELNVQLKELSSKELQWLYRRINLRGLNQKVKVTDFSPAAQYKKFGKDIEIDPVGNDIKLLFSGKIKPEDRYLKVSTGYGDSYQSFLSITELPDLNFPGSEYIFMVQDIATPIETCIHIKVLEEMDAKKEIKKFKKYITSEYNNAEESGNEPEDKVIDAYAEVKDMENEVYQNKKMLDTSITFCIAADNLDDLEKNVSSVRTYYENCDFGIERPISDQYKYYMEFIPGASYYADAFRKIMSLSSLAGTGIGASRLLGDVDGYYIGTTGQLNKKVLLNMARACLENKSAAATFYGNLGYGKSFNANLIMLIHIIYGAYGFIIDPKSERSNWLEKLPWLNGLTSIVRLTGEDKYKGVLDPFNVYRDNIEEACELALNIICELNGLSSKDREYIVLKETLVKLKSDKLPSMERLMERLEEFDPSDELAVDARMLARKLRTLQSIGMSKLLIGNGTEKSISFNNRLNILQIDNLKMPEEHKKKDDYTEEETLSTVLFFIMAHFAKKFAMSNPGIFKMELFDESWIMKKIPGGVELQSFLTRMGRSLFSCAMFNGHSVLDIPSEEIKNTISYKFCFHTDEMDEAKRMCEYLKIDDSKENINKLMNLQNRECMFRDLDGRVGVLRFDAVFEDIIECFSTTPIEEGKEEAI